MTWMTRMNTQYLLLALQLAASATEQTHAATKTTETYFVIKGLGFAKHEYIVYILYTKFLYVCLHLDSFIERVCKIIYFLPRAKTCE